MKHKTWFRLVIKAIGVLMIGLSLRSVMSLLVGFVYQSVQNRSLTLYAPGGNPIPGWNIVPQRATVSARRSERTFETPSSPMETP